MEALYVLLPVALGLVTGAVVAFRWAARDGQLDDLDTPPLRMLFDDQPPTRPAAAGAKGEVRP